MHEKTNFRKELVCISTKFKLKAALRSSNSSSASGEDETSIQWIIDTGDIFHDALLHVYNYERTTKTFPRIWKRAIIIPIRKQCKAQDLINSYRPISLLPVLGKVFEKMLHRRLEWFTEIIGILPNSQSGFRKGRNTVDNKIQLETVARYAINIGEIMIAVLVDFKSAFDHVCQILKGMDFPDAVIKFLFNYLSDRSYKVRVQNELSSIYFSIACWAPIGFHTQSLLFLLVLSELQFSNDLLSKLEFADDLVIWSASRDINIIANNINLELEELAAFSAALSLPISKDKTNAIMFHNKNSVTLPKLFVNNAEIWYALAPKFRGVYLDPRLTW